MLLAAAFLALAQAVQAVPPATASRVVETRAATPHGRLIALPDDAVAYIPSSAGPKPPLLVLLHGAGRGRMEMINGLMKQADKRGILLLAPTSKGVTWDEIRVALEPASPSSALAERLGHRFSGSRDMKRVDDAIDAFAKVSPFDRSRMVLGGFSDGATFALAMGMVHSQPFSAVIAWSPGIPIETSSAARGRPVFVSHGYRDQILSFDTDCSEILPLLQGEGAKVTFLPFDGVHEMPEVAKEAFLDAAFGPVPGTTPHPLPAGKPACHAMAPGMPQLPQPQPMTMTPME